MKSLSQLTLLALLLIGCESTDLKQSGKARSGTAEKEVSIVQGMTTSQVVALIGQPESIERNVDIGELKMDRWNYKIELERISEYREIEREPEPGMELEYAYNDPLRPLQLEDLAPSETVLVDLIRTRVIQILVYQDRVFAVASEIKGEYFEEDWREAR